MTQEKLEKKKALAMAKKYPNLFDIREDNEYPYIVIKKYVEAEKVEENKKVEKPIQETKVEESIVPAKQTTKTESNKQSQPKQDFKVEQKPKATSIKEEFASKGYNLEIKGTAEDKLYIVTKEGNTARYKTEKIKNVDKAIAE